jgi:hypothetical protein
MYEQIVNISRDFPGAFRIGDVFSRGLRVYLRRFLSNFLISIAATTLLPLAAIVLLLPLFLLGSMFHLHAITESRIAGVAVTLFLSILTRCREFARACCRDGAGLPGNVRRGTECRARRFASASCGCHPMRRWNCFAGSPLSLGGSFL